VPATNRFSAGEEDSGKRLDQFLTSKIAEVSRARVQQLITQRLVLVNGKHERAAMRLREGDVIEVTGEAKSPPLRATAEEIPLEIVYEDEWLAVINKTAGMMVHAGAGAHDDARNRGTLVNALLHHFQQLSGVSGELRPGIVHRLDKETSGLLVVAKNDVAHRKLAEQFSGRKVKKTYIALVHGWPKQASGTIAAPISRDRVRRTRMTTRSSQGREAVSHYKVVQRMDSRFGKFALLEVRIDTGRTHQIRVHLASLGHPVAGDTLYGAPRLLRETSSRKKSAAEPTLDRNFLHAAELEFQHPQSGKKVSVRAPLPLELTKFLAHVEDSAKAGSAEAKAKRGLM
jgi:23S rRNA pseudouridine1911/1915/1917 synthase